MNRILRIDMGAPDRPTALIDESHDYKGLFGRALSTAIISNEVPPMCFPLGEENKIVFAPSMITHGAFANTGHMSVGCKSPLTGAIHESNTRNLSAHMLKQLGYDAMILEGKPARDATYTIYINQSDVLILPSNDLKMLGSNALIKHIKHTFGPSTSSIIIGPVGEMKMSVASMGFSDINHLSPHYTCHGGAGAVMGSKKIKAIILDTSGLPDHLSVNPDHFLGLNTHFTNLQKHLNGRKTKINGIHHTDDIPILNACDIKSVNKAADHYGIDIIEMWSAIDMAVKAGVQSLDDEDAVLNLVHEIGTGTPIGRTLGSGALVAGKIFGVRKKNAKKNTDLKTLPDQNLFGVYLPDPGGISQRSDRFCSHGFQHQIEKKMMRKTTKKKRDITKAVIATTGYYRKIPHRLLAHPELLSHLAMTVNALTDFTTNEYTLFETGRCILRKETTFNEKAGSVKKPTRKPDSKQVSLPPFFTDKKHFSIARPVVLD